MGLGKDSGLELYSVYPTGERNLISDVSGVRVGHASVRSEDRRINTGVTVIIPHEGNIFREKLFAANAVINGFGKSIGLVQMDELGTLESPIFMTNTLSAGDVLSAGIDYMLEANPEIGVDTGTVNVVVTECNDGGMNDIRGRHVRAEDVRRAIESAGEDFEEGAVGAGCGMEMMGVKGGIGSASRLVPVGNKTYTVGALCLSNYGTGDGLVIGGDHIGRRIKASKAEDKGSCILVIATDAPLVDRQLKRLANRAAHALARTGSFSGNGSGDIAIAFSTANRIEHFNESESKSIEMLYDSKISPLFRGAVEAMEEALISSALHAEGAEDTRGRYVHGLKEYLEK